MPDQFDDFLTREVPKIEASPAFGSNGVIIVVYDEDERAGGLAPKNGLGSGGYVVCAIISPLAAPGPCGQKYYHYSVLRTVEDDFRLGGYLGSANDVTPIAAVWRSEVFAAVTEEAGRLLGAHHAAMSRYGIERDLHDGAQQHLVSLALQLRAAQAAAPPGPVSRCSSWTGCRRAGWRAGGAV